MLDQIPYISYPTQYLVLFEEGGYRLSYIHTQTHKRHVTLHSRITPSIKESIPILQLHSNNFDIFPSCHSLSSMSNRFDYLSFTFSICTDSWKFDFEDNWQMEDLLKMQHNISEALSSFMFFTCSCWICH